MTLKSLDLKSTYSTEESSLLHDFYIPAISEANKYDRAVGYFSAGLFSYAAQGLSKFLVKEGEIRLLVGELLSTEEYDAVQRGNELRNIEERIFTKLQNILRHSESVLLRKRFEVMSWLIAANRLTIRFGLTDRGIFHDKLGVLTDEENNQVVFQGSANETISALSPDLNYESIAVFPSWKPDVFNDYAMPYIRRFESMWNGDSKQLVTIDIPSPAYDALREYYKDNTAPDVDESAIFAHISHLQGKARFPRLPQYIAAQSYQIKGHQKDALQEWRARDYKGIFAHATGSGKTISSLHGATFIAQHHYSMGRDFVLIVAVPYQVLANQWCEVMQLFGIRAHRCYVGRRHWETKLRQAVALLSLKKEPQFLPIVVVNATLRSKEFQEIASKINANDLLFVGDECHHHQSLSILNKLPSARYRLGLSATPWRAADEDGRARLVSYYSGIVSVYAMGDALREGILTPYCYHAHQVELTAEEGDAYQGFSDQIAKLLAMKDEGLGINEDHLQHLMRARLRILGSADAKYSHLEETIQSLSGKTHCLFYCGDGSTELESDEGVIRDVERTARILDRNGWKSSRFTAEESARDRAHILEDFRYGYVDAIVAIRVLDEGFDMAECHSAHLLASSRNERQFIQRRGRILRKSAGKKSAVIHDFLLQPPASSQSKAFTSMVRYELIRAFEFARFSNNFQESMTTIGNVCSRFDIDVQDIEKEVLNMEVCIG